MQWDNADSFHSTQRLWQTQIRNAVLALVTIMLSPAARGLAHPTWGISLGYYTVSGTIEDCRGY